LRKAYGEEHTSTQEVRKYLSDLYAAQGQMAQARKYRPQSEN